MADEAIAVLVVTMDPLVREEARYGFSENVTVELVTDAREALHLMGDHVPDVAVVDIQTGSAGGFGLVREMRQTVGLQDVPVLMLLDRDQDAWLARSAGAKKHLTKPIDSARLASEALSLLRVDAK